MGGIVEVTKIVLTTGLLAESITENVLRAQLKQLIAQHEAEFQVMNELYDFIDKISQGSNSLQSQVIGNVLFVKSNWNMISLSLSDKIQLLKLLATEFPDVTSSDFNHSSQTGFKFGASLNAAAYIAYTFTGGRNQTSVSADSSNFKSFFSETSTSVRSSLPEIQGSVINHDGIIQRQSFGNNTASVPPQRRQSQVSIAKEQAKTSTIKSKVDLGFNLIFIAVDIFKFVEGVLNLIQLQKTVDAKKKYFQTDGQFDKGKQGVLQLMSLTVTDIFNMANQSRVALFESSNMLLVRSVILPRYNEVVLAYSKRLNADNFGLVDLFFKQTQDLINNCNSVVKSGKTLTEKLTDMKNHVKKFFDTYYPQKIFLSIASQISKVTGEYSVIAPSINDDQFKVIQFISHVGNIFKYERGENFNQKSVAQKKAIDYKILNTSIQKYNLIFDLNLNLASLDKMNKDILFQSVTSFCDQFYAEDDTGKSLFSINIKQTKSNINYRVLLESTQLNQANAIPVRNRSEAEETKQLDQWVNIAKELNKAEGYKYWGQAETVTAVFRYLRLKPEQAINNTGQFRILESFEGIRVKVNQKYFEAQRSVLKGTLTLKQA